MQSSLSAILFVSHSRAQVTVFERTPDGGWAQREFRSGELVEVAQPKTAFRVNDLYAGIALETA